jgi:hypothetical protein
MFIRAFTYDTVFASFPMPMMGIVMGTVTGVVVLAFLSNSDRVE